MTDEPDLSMLLPTTVAYLRMRADGFALARLNPNPAKRYAPSTDIHALIPLAEAAKRGGDPQLREMDAAFMLMWAINKFARKAVSQ
jgi:hypothetical protein